MMSMINNARPHSAPLSQLVARRRKERPGGFGISLCVEPKQLLAGRQRVSAAHRRGTHKMARVHRLQQNVLGGVERGLVGILVHLSGNGTPGCLVGGAIGGRDPGNVGVNIPLGKNGV